ncbi:nicotinate-nucleotide--dimethylbenzimidazole phosphoribosyltransferase [Salaquimonas pukyongi]|uniref:nicotinate-nucleotide--dimethylbenzimidazole phosphoribosyltransferase n=1 Tax=Salaquimonas pukyongi TaxID=2712698 RepID=UPI00096B884D|nr:nicotinate-nucleotide--dimethylbenzimidazole phosphoribosyltransferase [Salaquimonas pukyongi]
MLADFSISRLDETRRERIQSAIDNKTKPPGSLGRIEELALAIALCQQTETPSADPARLLIFAGDHGLTAEGVSAWPSKVTTQMVLNFLSGGAAANVFAKTNNVAITVADAGIIGDLPDHPDLVRAKIRKGTANALQEDALSLQEVDQALAFGARIAADAVQNGTKTVLLGEMGIGNTSSASLLAHAIAGIDLETLTGPGAGLDGDGVNRKLEILHKTAARRPGELEPRDALSAYGGLEIACMAGALIGAASAGGMVLVDGFIATAAALCALKARPEAAGYTVFSHRSKEPGHHAVLQALDATPLLDLDLRLGEGTGALLAFPLLRNACAMLNDMATFESAGVSGKE